jgi:hypothetical protein
MQSTKRDNNNPNSLISIPNASSKNHQCFKRPSTTNQTMNKPIREENVERTETQITACYSCEQKQKDCS